MYLSGSLVASKRNLIIALKEKGYTAMHWKNSSIFCESGLENTQEQEGLGTKNISFGY